MDDEHYHSNNDPTDIKRRSIMKKAFILPGLFLLSALTMAAVNGMPHGENGPELRPWNIDAPHTEINFSVKHFFTPVTGRFNDYEVNLMYDADDPENSTVSVVIDVASVNTNNERRDTHLRSEDFFNAEAYPKMTFESSSIRQVSANQLMAKGTLTIKDTTKEVELGINLLGITEIPEPMQEMMGGAVRVASFEAATIIDRRDFEVGVANWAQTMIVGGDVEISIALEANHQ